VAIVPAVAGGHRWAPHPSPVDQGTTGCLQRLVFRSCAGWIGTPIRRVPT